MTGPRGEDLDQLVVFKSSLVNWASREAKHL